KYLSKQTTTAPAGNPPVVPTAGALSMDYAAGSALDLNTSAADLYANRPGQFFHLAPFGAAEQHPYLGAGKPVNLLPQFDVVRDNAPAQSEAELYIGIDGLKPPQNLSLLFQVVPGTANPLATKAQIDWSYLANDQWTPFAANQVQDGTGELLKSGIVTLSVPRDATSGNTLLPGGKAWIRAA